MNNEPSCNLKCVSDVYLPVQSSMEAILDWLPVRNTGSLPRWAAWIPHGDRWPGQIHNQAPDRENTHGALYAKTALMTKKTFLKKN